MKLFSNLRFLLAAFLIASAAAATAAPTFIVSNGILMGANNVNVAGSLYNVSFADGSCNTLFINCRSFNFTTPASALAAAQALLDQVFVDGPNGQFNSRTELTFGCTDTDYCATQIPYTSTPSVGRFERAEADNFSSLRSDRTDLVYFSTSSGFGANFDSTDISSLNYAIFSLVTSAPTNVPEPSSIALFALVITGIAIQRRRKS